MNDRQKLAQQLRKTAAEYREQAKIAEREEAEKCAQVLVAARGLSKFKEILEGVR